MAARNIVVGQRVAEEKQQRALEMRREPTAAEHELWKRLRGNRLDGYHFRRQQVIDGFVVDFYCHRAGLVVEVDGEVHLTTACYDRERDDVLSRLGLRVLRFTNEQVINDGDEVVRAIRSAICRSEQVSTSPFPCREGGRGDGLRRAPRSGAS
jgi:very-short-patch-repair endonuclease